MSKEAIDPEDLSTILLKIRKGPERTVEVRKEQEAKAIDDAEKRKRDRSKAKLVQLNVRVLPQYKRLFVAICARNADSRGFPMEQGIAAERMIEICKDMDLKQ